MSDLSHWICVWKYLDTGTVLKTHFETFVGVDNPKEVDRRVQTEFKRDHKLTNKVRPWGICYRSDEPSGTTRPAVSRSASGNPDNSGSFFHPAHAHKNPSCVCRKDAVVQTNTTFSREVSTKRFRKLEAIGGRQCVEDDRIYVQRILDETFRGWRSQR